MRPIYPKVYGPYVVTLLNWTPVFKWRMVRPLPHERHRKFHNFLQHGTLPKKSLLFLVFLLILWDFRALMPGSPELHLLCHVTLLYCQVDPEARSKAKSEAK